MPARRRTGGSVPLRAEARTVFAPHGKRAGLRAAQSMLAEYGIVAGRPEEATARLVPLLDRSGVEELDVTLFVLPMLGWAYLELGDVDLAGQAITDSIRRVRAGPFRPTLVDGLRVRALVALRQGQWAAAEGDIQEGLALARAIPYPYGEGRLLEVEYLMHQDGREHLAARDRLEAAPAIFRRLGARKDVERIEQLRVTLS